MRRDPSVERRAYEAAQRLAELLEMLGMAFEAQVARDIRGRIVQPTTPPDTPAGAAR